MSATETKRCRLIEEMTYEERRNVASMDMDSGIGTEDVMVADMAAPPIDLANNIANISGKYRRKDDRDRHDRVERNTENWKIQMEYLVEAYLYFRSVQGVDGLNDDWVGNEDPEAPSIEVVDMFFRRRQHLKTTSTDKFPNETLIRNGLLGCAPLNPSVALTIRTLHAFRQMRRNCPRLSISGFCKALCLIHSVPYQPYLATQFSDVYDVYLQIYHWITPDEVDKFANEVTDAVQDAPEKDQWTLKIKTRV
ncbi:hypothetical protein F5887DRAFT_1079846 [Amanita rubescens]|nr:hypothetical protein F5887DRAFT_1079846 [Amanita rubescens]